MILATAKSKRCAADKVEDFAGLQRHWLPSSCMVSGRNEPS
jgi:hypothetical protein